MKILGLNLLALIAIRQGYAGGILRVPFGIAV